VTDSYLTFI